MRHKLGLPGCPKCKGEGTIPGEPIRRPRQDGSMMEYPTVIRCACLAPAPDPSSGAAERKPDAQERAAGEKE